MLPFIIMSVIAFRFLIIIQNTNLIGNCSSTRYGCCKDNITYCENKNCSNCYQTNLIGIVQAQIWML